MLNLNTSLRILGVVGVSLLFGCASTPFALAPVGPYPGAAATQDANGRLQVYSAAVGFTTDNPAWYLHTDYSICNEQGRPLEQVNNTVDNFSAEPRVVSLRPGRYLVRAQAKDWSQVTVPVVIEAGRTTIVHLDNDWRPAADFPKAELVILPSGHPVGWRVDAAQ